VISADPQLRDRLSGLSTAKLIRHCAELPVAAPHDTASAATYTLRLLARRISELTWEITDLDAQMSTVLAAHNPALLNTYRVGPDTAAALLLAAGDNPERLRSEASSGKTQRHRLNRGGDRQANCALHTIVLARLRWDERTRRYVDRCITAGRTRREAIRCLKRYVAREIYRLIKQPQRTTTTAAA
jgi:transposase